MWMNVIWPTWRFLPLLSGTSLQTPHRLHHPGPSLTTRPPGLWRTQGPPLSPFPHHTPCEHTPHMNTDIVYMTVHKKANEFFIELHDFRIILSEIKKHCSVAYRIMTTKVLKSFLLFCTVVRLTLIGLLFNLDILPLQNNWLWWWPTLHYSQCSWP